MKAIVAVLPKKIEKKNRNIAIAIYQIMFNEVKAITLKK